MLQLCEVLSFCQKDVADPKPQCDSCSLELGMICSGIAAAVDQAVELYSAI